MFIIKENNNDDKKGEIEEKEVNEEDEKSEIEEKEANILIINLLKYI